MSYDTKKDTITVNDVTYDVKREPDRGSPEETLTVCDFDIEQDDWVFPFPGLEATLGYEEYIEEHDSPREWSNVGNMAVSYRGYDLGDEDITNEEFECSDCNGYGEFEPDAGEGPMEQCSACKGEGNINPVAWFKKERGARVVIGLTVYEHSGITMRAGDVTLPFDTDRWDTSFVGFIYDTPEGVEQCIGANASDEEIEAALRDEVAIYARYLEGDVTRWSVQDEETDYFDACGGYVGDHEQCERECFAALEQAIIKRLGENEERAHWNARDVPTK